MRLSNFIRDNIETIVQEWEVFATTLVPAGQAIDHTMLRDHAKKMLETIAIDLACPESPQEKKDKSKGLASPCVKKSAATEHGSERMESGFSLNATVSEYRALRASVTQLWEAAQLNQPAQQSSIDDLIRFNEAIDQAISESVASFTIGKDQQTRVFDTILSSSPDLSCTFDLEGRYTYANKALTEVLGLSPDKIIGRNCFDLDRPNAAELQRQIRLVAKTKEQWRGEMTYTTPSGEADLYEYILVPILDNTGAVEAVAGTARNITQRKATEDENWKKANYDILTGLPNRRLFLDRLEQNIKHAARFDTPLALLFIDLDYFKETNDTLGHDAGDLLLQMTAERVRSCVRETDTVSRLGGDEFTVILQDHINTKDVKVIAGKVLKELARPFQIFTNTVQISASVGITLFPQDADTSEQLIKNADQAMYAAKIAGRNRCSFFSANLALAAENRLQLIEDFRDALPQHQLTVYYQPILNIADGRIIKAEALLRWCHPEMGLMIPEQFIGLAEEAGLMNEIGQWVFTEAALRSSEWSALVHMPFQVSINMSAMQFIDHSHIMHWGEYIKNLGLASHSISVDIKENVLLNESEDVSDSIADLHNAGIQLAVENFGAGYSSIACLKKFAIDFIKIDQSLVHEMATDANSHALTEGIIVMAHTLGLKVIAEGVETMEQRDTLEAAGCDYAQGYLFAAPVRAAEFSRMLSHP